MRHFFMFLGRYPFVTAFTILSLSLQTGAAGAWSRPEVDIKALARQDQTASQSPAARAARLKSEQEASFDNRSSKPELSLNTAEKTGDIGLFGSQERRSDNMSAFAKWTRLWRENNLPRRALLPTIKEQDTGASQAAEPNAQTTNLPPAFQPQICPPRNKITCEQENWEGFIADEQAKKQAGSEDFYALLSAVNRFMNRHRYILDPLNWGLPDYWATPDEFFMKDGDCEDYAISKYASLKRLGFDPKKMRLVVVQDENLRTPHAVLAVEHEGEIYILDNQVDAVLKHQQILHYRPVYSINEEAWWLHQRASSRRFGRP